jgi:hypothetical protein
MHNSSFLIMSYRNCSCCGRYLQRDSYTNEQWVKGERISQCAACVHKKPSNDLVVPNQTARRNNAQRAEFLNHALDYPFAQGAFRWVAKGKYTEGERAGQECVCKWFKTGGVTESSFYDADLNASKEAT